MSAIAGMLRFDGGMIDRRALARAANALKQYGPDRSDVVAAGPVGLAHVLMRMTPEDRFDRQPERGLSSALISADLRLDNRDDVLAHIGVTPRDAASWSDARVLLAAWEKCGDAIWPRLRGPFAVAIWDPRARVLTLARDPVGLNVVMWHRSKKSFAFASMPNGLFAFADVPRRLSEEKFADFLVLNHADHAATMYRDVFRLRPAYVMQVGGDGVVREWRYWSPSDIAPVRLACEADYAEGLRAVLDRAVRRQMRSAHPIGCLLSGGLDSSSVAALVARALSDEGHRLAAFTGVPRRGYDGDVPAGTYADETPYVEAIAKTAGNIDVSYVRAGECDDFAELERFFVALEGPVRNPGNLGWVLAALRLARARGRRVLLGGLTGNTTISWSGWSQAASHLKRGRLITAARQGNLYYRCTPYSRWAGLRQLLLEPLAPERFSWWADRRHADRTGPWQEHSPIRPAFAAAMGVEARARRAGHDFHDRMRP
ncbi:MAG: asparagine synthase-related protein, partial [Pseudolabrys sp.]